MNSLDYKTAYNKIIDAYFKDEIQPFHPDFCFCGTLNNNTDSWCSNYFFNGAFKLDYTVKQFADMEAALLEQFQSIEKSVIRDSEKPGDWCGWVPRDHPKYEETLFNGMCAALDVLKEIHKSRGENVDELPALTKRVLCTK